jgi:hypothetical protein
MRCEIGNVANESWCQSSGGHHGTLSPTLNHYSINQGRQSNLTSNVARQASLKFGTRFACQIAFGAHRAECNAMAMPSPEKEGITAA